MRSDLADVKAGQNCDEAHTGCGAWADEGATIARVRHVQVREQYVKVFAGDTADPTSFLTEPADEQGVPFGAIEANNVNRSFAFG